MDNNDNKDADLDINTINKKEISPSTETSENTVIEENTTIEITQINNKFIKFIDKHALGISMLIGCIYVISSWFVTFSLLNINNVISLLFLGVYYLFLISYILLYIGLSVYYKNLKYFAYLLLGFLIGLFTCGGLILGGGGGY